MAVTKGRDSVAHETKTVKVGDKAPNFSLATYSAKDPWQLSDQAGKKNVVIAFYPFAFTPT